MGAPSNGKIQRVPIAGGRNTMRETDRAKAYLGRIRQTDREIDQLVETTQRLRERLINPGSGLGRDTVYASGSAHPMEDTMAKIIDLDREINDQIDQLIDQKREAMERIQRIHDRDRQTVLIARYLSGMHWARIAGMMGFSIAQVYRIHAAALEEFAERGLPSQSRCTPSVSLRETAPSKREP
jgi:DNA-directed RNA polymerase specialized sigma subunit